MKNLSARSPTSSSRTHLAGGLAYYDQPAIRKIVREAAPSEYRWSSVILGVVKSAPFQMRMVGTAPATVAGRP